MENVPLPILKIPDELLVIISSTITGLIFGSGIEIVIEEIKNQKKVNPKH